MKKVIDYLNGIDGWMYVILFFCLIGLIRNIVQNIHFGFDYSGIPTKVFVAMSVIYLAQIVLILMKEPKTWVISAIQTFFCAYVFEDFTFVPITNAIKMVVYHFAPSMGYGWHYFVNSVVISALFSLEMLKTYLIAVLLEPAPAQPKAQPAKAE